MRISRASRRRRSKEAHELGFWLEQRRREGGRLENGHYEHFFTEYFGLGPGFYEGKAVLDVGCGPRGSLERLTTAARRVGLDPLADAYRRHLGTRDHAMEYVAAPAEEMPFEDGAFDVVTSFNSLDHVEDVSGVTAEMRRVLAPGGTLLLATDINHAPTPMEPQTFGPEVVERFTPALRVVEVRYLRRHVGGLFASLLADDRLDRVPDEPAVLLARFEKPAG